jgi:hypothetical protein
MSERALATFLHNLLAGRHETIGPVRDAATLQRLLEQPAPLFHDLLSAHVDALLAGLPGGAALRPAALPTTTLWLAAVLNNLVWAGRVADPQLLNVSLRLAGALPPAHDLPAALAGHSLLQHLARITLPADWRPVRGELLARYPLTAAWLLPRCGEQPDWTALQALLEPPPLQALLRDRWLSLAPGSTDTGMHAWDLALANAEIGALLEGLLAADASWLAFVLEFYEADCELQRRERAGQLEWPLLAQLRSARHDRDYIQRRRALRSLDRYRPLAGLLRRDSRLLRPYARLDPRFLVQLAELLPEPRLHWEHMSRGADVSMGQEE